MVADLSLISSNAGSDTAPVDADIDGLGPPHFRFKQGDNITIDAVDPMPIPTAGTNYSKWKQLTWQVDTAPDTQVDNFKTYTDGGGFGTGISVRVGDQFPGKTAAASAGYQIDDNTPPIDFNGGHTVITTDSDLFSFTSGAPQNGPTIGEAGGILDAVGEHTNYTAYQMEVISTASPGDLADETQTTQYDEI